MPADTFIDTHILLYVYDLDAPEKRRVAMEIIKAAFLHPLEIATSVQVLQEFHVNFTRKGNPPVQAAVLIEDFSNWTVIDNTLTLFGLGLTLQARWQLSLRDSMILAAAQISGAKELLSEDLNHNQDYGGVRVINPFI
jgi:predicted nucleic acid-binding protein